MEALTDAEGCGLKAASTGCDLVVALTGYDSGVVALMDCGWVEAWTGYDWVAA